jgi:hypothetical protein
MVPQTVEMRIILSSVTRKFVLKGTHAVSVGYTVYSLPRAIASYKLFMHRVLYRACMETVFIPPALEERERGRTPI